MSKNKEKTSTIKNKAKITVSDFGVFLLVSVFPLFITNKYYNLTISKFLFFTLVTVISLFSCLVFCDKTKKSVPDKKPKSFLLRLKQCDKLSLSFFAFLISGLFSMLFSPYPYSSLLGYAGRYMGFDFVLTVVLLYCFISRYYSPGEREIAAFEISGTLVILLAATEFFGFDPFRLMKSVPKENLGMFLSTIGNINVLASFIALFLPISIYYMTFSGISKLSPIFITATVFGYIGIFVSNSDSAYLSLLAAVWIIGLCVTKSSISVCRFLSVVSLFFLCAFVFGIIHGACEKSFHLSDITVYITDKRAVIAFIVLMLLALIIKYKPLSERLLKALKGAYIAFSVLLVILIVIAIIYFSIVDIETPLNGFLSFLRFNDSWGTKRGTVWRMGLSSFCKMPFINKLFGYGEDTVVVLFAKYFKQEMLSSGYYTDNAHNEYLQYLLTMGIFGLTAYLSVLFFALKKLFKKSREHILFGAIFASVFAYAVQAFVNISQPITTPIMFLFMAFAGCELKNNPYKGSHK